MKLRFTLAIPVLKSCKVKFIFPSDHTFKIDELTSYVGSSLIISGDQFLTKDPDTRTVIIQNCPNDTDAFNPSLIKFKKIRNPIKVKTTGTMQVFVMTGNDKHIAELTTGITLISTLILPGLMTDINVLPKTTYEIQKATEFNLEFNPPHLLLASCNPNF
jgi:hypothetical protein